MPEPGDALGPLLAALVAASLLASIEVVRRLSPAGRRWGETLRSRLLYGVPWGTLLVVAFVLGFYLVVQDGVSDFENPVALPYRAWSYFYPLGIVTSSFAHAGSGHLVGNLVGTAVVAPIAEFAWGHYPPGGRRDRDAPRRWDDPRVRAFVIFPGAVLAVGLVTGLFALGPVIGFSGVVFAFAGFALVRYPIATVLATLGAQGVLSTVYWALRNPIYVYEATPGAPSAPSWATVAIQGHALGFLVGVLLCAAVLERRGRRPDPLRFWLALVFFAFAKSLWAIYWFGGRDTYVLYRGPGVVVVLALALLVTVAVAGSDRPLLPARLRRRLAGDAAPTARPLSLAFGGGSAPDAGERIRALASGGRARTLGDRLAGATRRRSALLAVVLVVALLAGPAIPANLFVVEGEPSAAAVTVEDYSVEYVEGAENELISVVDLSPYGLNSTVESSGLVVSSEERNLWIEAVPARQLEFAGEETVYVGGPGWRESVTVEREGWSAVGNETAYRVWIEADDDRHFAHASDPVDPDVRIDGRDVRIVPEEDGFFLDVTGDGDETRVEIPAENETVAANGLQVEREEEVVFARSDGTRVPIASEEEYRDG